MFAELSRAALHEFAALIDKGIFTRRSSGSSDHAVQLHLQGDEILSGAVMNGVSGFALLFVMTADGQIQQGSLFLRGILDSSPLLYIRATNEKKRMGMFTWEQHTAAEVAPIVAVARAS